MKNKKMCIVFVSLNMLLFNKVLSQITEDRHIFCCSEDNDRAALPPVVSDGLRVSQRKCLEYASCQERYQGLGIVGGLPAKPGEFPFIAAIGWKKKDGDMLWGCGGSLISERFVLTAAHCAYFRDESVISTYPEVVRLGELDFSTVDDRTEHQDIAIGSMLQHPLYTPRKRYHDLALIKLAATPKMNQYVWPLCLWQQHEAKNDLYLVATGWGRVSFGGNSSDILLKVELNEVNTSSCAETYKPGDSRRLDRGIVSEQLCAGDSNGGKDTCQGDSGGPLTQIDLKKNCLYHLVGVTSFGVGCGTPAPGVYSRVHSYLDWIEKTVWPESFRQQNPASGAAPGSLG